MAARKIGEGRRPLICTPLAGENKEAVIDELQQVLVKNPDVIEWRADFFQNVADTAQVIAVAKLIKEMAGDLLVIFTIRSSREGGQPIALTDREAIELNAEICRNTTIEYVDCELSNDPAHIQYLRQEASKYGTKIIGSFHNFTLTPSRDELTKTFTAAEEYGLDVAKVAVMPQDIDDVLRLLGATSEAKKRLSIPLITMSMGKYGAVSRMLGGVFGSSLSFAVGAKSSAPGQIPIEDLQTVLDIIEKTLGEG